MYRHEEKKFLCTQCDFITAIKPNLDAHIKENNAFILKDLNSIIFWCLTLYTLDPKKVNLLVNNIIQT